VRCAFSPPRPSFGSWQRARRRGGRATGASALAGSRLSSTTKRTAIWTTRCVSWLLVGPHRTIDVAILPTFRAGVVRVRDQESTGRPVHRSQGRAADAARVCGERPHGHLWGRARSWLELSNTILGCGRSLTSVMPSVDRLTRLVEHRLLRLKYTMSQPLTDIEHPL
jgi:hypothetical protein